MSRGKLTGLRNLLRKLTKQLDPMAGVCPNCRRPVETTEFVWIQDGRPKPEPPPSLPCLWPGRCKGEDLTDGIVIYHMVLPDDLLDDGEPWPQEDDDEDDDTVTAAAMPSASLPSPSGLPPRLI